MPALPLPLPLTIVRCRQLRIRCALACRLLGDVQLSHVCMALIVTTSAASSMFAISVMCCELHTLMTVSWNDNRKSLSSQPSELAQMGMLPWHITSKL